MTLPDGCCLRPAIHTDAWAIRRLVFSAWLDPTQIRWNQFWVIECDRQLIGCGQLRRFGDAQELGSLVIRAQWRHRGLGTTLTNHLIQNADRALYLECLGDRLLRFYSRLGFIPADWTVMPASIKKKFQTTRWLSQVLPIPLFILAYSNDSSRAALNDT